MSHPPRANLFHAKTRRRKECRREAYKEKYGEYPNLPGSSSGERRTESKKALLKAIEDLGGKW